jgi:UDP-N-acetylglucosamine transferase subunit ALG13
VILVLLGTHPAPMDALVEELDRLVDAGVVADEVVIQAARFGRSPRHARTVEIVPYRELQRLIAAADVVISHAGPATLADVRASGKSPVVIARSPARGEHVDDHQLRYAGHLRDQPGYIVPSGLDELGMAIAQARATSAAPVHRDVSRAVAVLERLHAAGRSR